MIFKILFRPLAGYVQSEDMEGLKVYYSQLQDDCTRVNNLTMLNPNVINHPAVYSLLTNKYYKADELGIRISFEIFLDLNEIKMKIYDFTKVLAILMDNAIEAASQCDEKLINLIIRKDGTSPRQLVIVENTYTNKDVDTEKIFEKGYTSKKTEDAKTSHGLGLWEVRKILSKSKNLNLYTSKDDKFFKQQLEIYLT